ncbi:MAG: pilus assembly protein [Candidatus Omnitrophica bacterium]|nr:pilus assembly protein [Candidatus Omnitrophota bacterium]
MKKAQATLEFTLAFIVMVALIAGLLNLWSWSNGHIGARQGAYEGSRVGAGSKDSPGEPAVPYGAGQITDSRTYLFKK